jgi:HK97 gp10 family phage protein
MIRLLGVARTQAAFLKVRTKFEAASPIAARAGASIIQREMVARAPVRTGRLRNSIATDVTSTGEGATARVGADVPYDRFVQLGTVYMEPQAYGEEAAVSGTAAVVGVIAAVYKAVL